jgi:hypothetical protein
VRHQATPKFWASYRQLPGDIQRLADDSYQVLRRDPKHPSLHFKRVGRYWSVRVGLHYRSLAVEAEGVMVWFRIGTDAEYNRLLGHS